MATRKPTTTVKKTTKKPAAKAAKARTSKVSTKVTAVKATAKQAPKVQSNRLAGLTINRLWLAAAVLFAGAAVAAVLLMDRTSFMLSQTHMTRDALLSQQETAFIPAARPMWDVELRWLLASLLVLSMAAPVLYLTRLKGWYADRVANRRMIETRWLDIGVTSAIMIEIVALMAGYTDLATLKLMAGLLVVTAGLSWLAERQNEKARRPEWSAFGLSVVTGLLPWLAIGAAHLATWFYGEVRSPWYVYAATAVAFIGFGLLTLNQWNQHRRFGDWADYALAERNYVLASALTKLAFAGILIIGLSK